MIGFDADQDCSGVAELAKSRGVAFICRYLKNLGTQEIQILSAAGLQIVSIFESTAERAKEGAEAGAEDSARALEQASALGQPQGSAIYATADFDCSEEELEGVLGYFRAFKAGLGSEGKLGVYGCGRVCEATAAAGVADFTWLAGGLGMNGSREFAKSGNATIQQDVGDKRGLDLGISIDSDLASTEDFGGWRLET